MEAPEPFLFYLIVFILPILVTVPVTVLLCRVRAARKKRVSYGTVATGASFIPLLMLLFFTMATLFGRNDGKAPKPLLFLQLEGFVACLCVLPALIVVMYYQRKGKSEKKSFL
jgi:hypothetical protein